MKRPQSFHGLPYRIRERIIDNCDLEYCPYESSQAQAKEDVLLGEGYNAHHANNIIAEEAYKFLSDSDLEKMIQEQIESAKKEIDMFTKMLQD